MPEAKGIKHSWPTAWRTATVKWEVQRIRRSAKVPPPVDRIRCGLLGAGGFFRYAHAPALNLKGSPLAVTGILARSPEKFNAAQRELRFTAQSFATPEELFAANIQAVLILLPNHLHFEMARAAVERGLDVYCEKPLTLTVAEAQRLKTVAQKSGRVVMNGFNQRYFDRHRVIKSWLAEGKLGRITSVRAYHNQDLRGLPSYDGLRREVTGGGVVLNAGIHLLNLLLDWFGPLERVGARFENRALPVECGEDTAACDLHFGNGVKATLEASLANGVASTYEHVVIEGTEGRLTSDLKRSEIRWQPNGKPQLKIACRPEIMRDSVAAALAHFAECVRRRGVPETSIDDFIPTLRAVQAMTLAAAQKREVNLNELAETNE